MCEKMSKQLPVYDLGQWIRGQGTIGRIVAKSTELGFQCVTGYESTPVVSAMATRGAGYCVEWVELSLNGPFEGPIMTKATARMLRWLRPDTIADPRYTPCDNPVSAPREPAQQPLALDIEVLNETMARSAVALGKIGADWLRAKGLTV